MIIVQITLLMYLYKLHIFKELSTPLQNQADKLCDFLTCTLCTGGKITADKYVQWKYVNAVDIVSYYICVKIIPKFCHTLLAKTHVTGFWKTNQIVTLDLFHKLAQLMATLVHYA